MEIVVRPGEVATLSKSFHLGCWRSCNDNCCYSHNRAAGMTCPLLAQLGSVAVVAACLLLGEQRTTFGRDEDYRF